MKSKIITLLRALFKVACRLAIRVGDLFRRPRTPEVKFSFVVLTWNRKEMLALTLRELLRNLSGKFDYEVIVWNNGSTDGTREFLDETYGRTPCVRIVHSGENLGLNAYHQLFPMAKGEIIMEVDDDILEFPKDFDVQTLDYMKAFPDYSYFALNPVQNEHTNGARPSDDQYVVETRGALTMMNGPAGGWCSAFRAAEYRRFAFIYNRVSYSFRHGEDGTLMFFFKEVFGQKHGLMKGLPCLHATGPYYAKQFNSTKRDHEKYLREGFYDRAKCFEDK